ncbi:MAG: flagellar hook-length control protein FliK [Spirochaetales bacterium]|nr:flagellar hook-length control protein FliK [Spirochaetales bacterium]
MQIHIFGEVSKEMEQPSLMDLSGGPGLRLRPVPEKTLAQAMPRMGTELPINGPAFQSQLDQAFQDLAIAEPDSRVTPIATPQTAAKAPESRPNNTNETTRPSKRSEAEREDSRNADIQNVNESTARENRENKISESAAAAEAASAKKAPAHRQEQTAAEAGVSKEFKKTTGAQKESGLNGAEQPSVQDRFPGALLDRARALELDAKSNRRAEGAREAVTPEGRRQGLETPSPRMERGQTPSGVKQSLPEALRDMLGARSDREFASAAKTNDRPQAREAAVRNAESTKGSGLVHVELDEAKWKVRTTVSHQNERVEAQATMREANLPGRGESQGQSRSDGESRRESRLRESRMTDQPRVNREITTETLLRDFSRMIDQERVSSTRPETASSKDLMNRLVQKAFLELKGDGQSTATIRLNPQHLGRMTLNLQVSHNHVSAQVLVDSEAALRAVKGEMDTLRGELLRQGITVDGMSIRIRENAEMAFAGNQGDGQAQQGMAAGAHSNGENAGDLDAHEAAEFSQSEYERNGISSLSDEAQPAGALRLEGLVNVTI